MVLLGAGGAATAIGADIEGIKEIKLFNRKMTFSKSGCLCEAGEMKTPIASLPYRSCVSTRFY